MIRRLIDRLRFARDHRWSPGHMSEYLDGELGSGGRRRIERHTRDCPRCRELLEGLRTMVGALGRMRSERGEAPPQVTSSVVAGVQRRLREDADDRSP